MLPFSLVLAVTPLLLLAGAFIVLGRWRTDRSRSFPLVAGLVLAALALLDVVVLVFGDPSSHLPVSWATLLVGAAALIVAVRRPESPAPTGPSRLQHFADAALEGVAFVREGRILDANERLAAMVGMTRSEMVGLALDRLLPPQTVKPRNRSIPDGYDRVYEARVRGPARSLPVEVLEGSAQGARRLILRDITDQRKTEELFRESEESFRELAESVTQVFFAIDGDYTVTYWNKASEYLTGVSSRDAVGNHLFRLLGQLQGTVAEEAFREVLQTRDAHRVTGEFVLGSEPGVWEVRVNPSRRGLSVFLENITLRTRAAEALRESEERFRRLADHAPGMIYRLRPGPPIIIEYASPASVLLTGYAVGELTAAGRALEEFVLAEDRPAVQRLLDPGEGVPVVLRWVTSTGAVAWLEHRTSLVRDEKGEVVAGEGIAIDITGRIEAERRITASLEEKEALLKEIHHRVKNNLQIISSLLSLQSETVTHAPALEALKESQGRIRSMAMIHEQLYRSGDLSRIEFDSYVRDLTNHLLRTYSVAPGRITLELQVEPLPLGIDKAIPCGIIINELVSNSIKHAFGGRPGGSIEIALRREEDGMLALSVRDDGVGLPPAFRIDDCTSLGMKLVQALSEQLRGSLQLTGDAGTTISLRFPV